MSDPTYRPLTGEALWAPGDILGGALLDPGWPRETCAGPWYPIHSHDPYGATQCEDCGPPCSVDWPRVLIDLRLQRERDHARRVLLAGERCRGSTVGLAAGLGCCDGWVQIRSGSGAHADPQPCDACNGSGYLRKPADIGPIIEAELRGDITPTEAAGLVWCSLLRVEAGLGVVGLPLTVEPDEGDLSEWLADGWTLWSDGALLMPLPDGVIGRLEVSDG